MQQHQRFLQYCVQGKARFGFCVGGRVVLHVALDQFKIPVAEFAPQEPVQALGRVIEAVAFNGGIAFGLDFLQPVQDPAVMQPRGRVRIDGLGHGVFLQIHEREP